MLDRTSPELATAPLCDYFVRCERPAAGFVVHPVAGRVASCERCAQVAALRLHPRPVSLTA